MPPVTIDFSHWLFLFWVIVCIVLMGFRRDPLIPCILGLFSIGWVVKHSFVGGIVTIFNGLVVAGKEFLDIIVIISIIVALSKLLSETGADYIIMKPAAKLMVNAHISYWIIGATMLIASWFFWPSPATALIGAIIFPVAVRAGLPPIGCAVAMNLFGHGIGLSTDYVIQGAPAITSKAAGITTMALIKASIPLAITMGLVTTLVAYFMLRKEIKEFQGKLSAGQMPEGLEHLAIEKIPQLDSVSYSLAFLTPLVFGADIVAMFMFDLRGGDATALLGGTALALMCFGTLLKFKFDGFEKLTDYTKEGFMFGIKIFAPVIIIGAFFFMGKGELAKAMMGKGATGFLEDFGYVLSQTVSLNAVAASFITLFTGIIVGLDGSGFSPLPLAGSVAATLGEAAKLDTSILAALGQMSGVWTGGGTIIPWGVIPVAAITGVNPIDLARKNLIPVIIGFLVTTLVAILLL